MYAQQEYEQFLQEAAQVRTSELPLSSSLQMLCASSRLAGWSLSILFIPLQKDAEKRAARARRRPVATATATASSEEIVTDPEPQVCNLFNGETSKCIVSRQSDICLFRFSERTLCLHCRRRMRSALNVDVP